MRNHTFPAATVISPNPDGFQASSVTWHEPPVPPATLLLVDQHRIFLLEARNAPAMTSTGLPALPAGEPNRVQTNHTEVPRP